MPSASDLRTKVSFQRRAANEDGQRLGDFAEEFTHLAGVTFTSLRTGGEVVLQGRLQNVVPVSMIVRDDQYTRQIDSSWRAVIAGGHMAGTYNIRSRAPSARSGWLTLTCDTGDDD